MSRSLVRVAIVDDNRQFAEALSVLLELEPDVKVVGLLEDGEEAVEHARGEAADVYLVDFRLPDADGLQLLHECRRHAARSGQDRWEAGS